MYKNLAEFEFRGQRSKVKVNRDKKRHIATSGALRAVYVWENIFSIAGMAGVAVGHDTTSVTK